ncbi:hypothetical protein [Haladaptatus sp. ZSTT2]|uniref:hypothetical protein n=1 Tax=Haladaptatus sp. ZSTT2 TaxID=3120515 RepID=UPI00300EE1DF
MSQYTTPVSAAFEMQRTMINQSQRMAEQSVAFQKSMGKLFLNGLESQKSAQQSGVAFTKAALHSYFDAIEATIPGSRGNVEQVRDIVDEQFETLSEGHSELYEGVEQEFERSLENYDELSEEYLNALKEQTTLVLENAEDMEAQTVEAVERFESQAEEFQEQAREQLDA